MKKSRILVTALAATMCATSILGLVACSKEANEIGNEPDQPVTPAVYTVTYDANGGTFGSGVATTAYTVDGKLTSILTGSQVTYNGHNFDGWYTAQTGGTKITLSYTFDGDKTIYAHWTPVQTGGDDGDGSGGNEGDDNPSGTTFTITFDTQGGTLAGGAAATATTGADGKLASYPTATGDTEFLGWALEEICDEFLDVDYVFSADTTIYAQWGVDDEPINPDNPDNPNIPATQKVVATEAGVCYLVGQFAGDSVFNADLGYACTNDDASKPDGAMHQFKLVVHLSVGDIVKFKYNKTAGETNDVWASWLENDDGGKFGTQLVNFNDDGGNQNIRVNAAGTYTFYIKAYPDGGGSIWVDDFAED